MIRKLTEREFKALEEIYAWDKSAAYWWKHKSMEKLAIKALVEPHPAYPRGYRITDAGRKFIEGFPPKDWNTADQ